MAAYDPFPPGPSRVAEHALHAREAARDRVFPVDLWLPVEESPPLPLVVFSHAAAQGRRSAAYLCAHLASHGFAVAAMDHSELVARELARPATETEEEKARRWRAVIDARVPDLRFLVDHLLDAAPVPLDRERIGAVGHSFGGWTVLAAPESDRRIASVVALAPGGASNPRPGILPATLAFTWVRDVPALFLAAEDDSSTPLPGILELVERTPGPKRLVVLGRADHLHFREDAGEWHERFRTMPAPPELAEIQREMRPMGELQSGEQAHLFTRALTLAHLDATLRCRDAAAAFLSGSLESDLAAHGIEARVHRPGSGSRMIGEEHGRTAGR